MGLVQSLTRVVSGKGEFRIPLEEIRKARRVVMYSQLARTPRNQFLNLNYVPAKGFYANVNFWYNGYVVREDSVNYPRQVFDLFNGQSSQNLKALKCMNANIGQDFFDLFVGLQIPNIRDNWIDDYSNDVCEFDRLTFSCYSNTGLELTLSWEEYEVCEPIDTPFDNPRQPPPPPTPLQPLSPDQQLFDISPPYDDPDSPYEDITEPFDGDEIEPPLLPDFPFGEECVRYLVIGAMTDSQNGRILREDEFFGEIEDFYFNPSQTSGTGRDAIIIRSRGLAVFNDVVQPCGDPVDQIFLDAAAEDYVSHEIISVTLVEDQ